MKSQKLLLEIEITDINSRKHGPIYLNGADFTTFDGKTWGLVQKRPETRLILDKISLFSAIFFLWNKGNFGIPSFDKFPNFDANKG